MLIFLSDIMDKYTMRCHVLQSAFDGVSAGKFQELAPVKIILSNSENFKMLEGDEEDKGSYMLQANFDKSDDEFYSGLSRLVALLVFDLKHGSGSYNDETYDKSKFVELADTCGVFLSECNTQMERISNG